MALQSRLQMRWNEAEEQKMSNKPQREGYSAQRYRMLGSAEKVSARLLDSLPAIQEFSKLKETNKDYRREESFDLPLLFWPKQEEEECKDETLDE